MKADRPRGPGMSGAARPGAGLPLGVVVRALLLPACLPVLVGCEPMTAYLMHVFRPEPTEEAKFKLTKDRLALLVDEAPDQQPGVSVRFELVGELHREFANRKINFQVVPDNEVHRLQATRPTTARWTAARIGRELGARQVVHVQLDGYRSASPMRDPSLSGRLSGLVKVFDAQSGEQLFPLESAGEPVAFEIKRVGIDIGPPDPALMKNLAVGLADRIAKLFYKHTISEREETLRTFKEERESSGRR